MSKQKPSRLDAARCAGALLRWLQDLPPEAIVKMRARAARAGRKPEESRDWSRAETKAPAPGGILRTRTGYVYR